MLYLEAQMKFVFSLIYIFTVYRLIFPPLFCSLICLNGPTLFVNEVHLTCPALVSVVVQLIKLLKVILL